MERNISRPRVSESGSRGIAVGGRGGAAGIFNIRIDSWGECSLSTESNRLTRTLRKKCDIRTF